MTILEALERAKRIRDEKARQGVSEPSTTQPRVSRRRGVVADTAELRTVSKLEFEQLPVDAGVCERNRVLMLSDRNSPHSGVVDAYRILRTRIHGAAAQRWRSLGFLSSGPGEGKTLTAINLALAFARDKKSNVFLLDLDLRNPSVCKYLGVAPRVEVGSALHGEAKPEEVFFGIGIENLVIAGGVSRYENSSELLGGHGLDELLAYINGIDPQALILVDLPPVLLSADALVVAPKLSAALLIIAEGITRRDQLDRTLEVLSGTKVAGIVLNRSREAVEDYYG